MSRRNEKQSSTHHFKSAGCQQKSALIRAPVVSKIRDSVDSIDSAQQRECYSMSNTMLYVCDFLNLVHSWFQ